MRSLIRASICLSFCLAIASNLLGSNTFEQNQVIAKTALRFSNNKTLQEFEDTLKAQFPHMPRVVVTCSPGLHVANLPHMNYCYPGVGLTTLLPDENVVNVEYFPAMSLVWQSWLNPEKREYEDELLENVLCIPAKIVTKDEDQMRWSMHHALGHAQYPTLTRCIRGLDMFLCISIAYRWKKLWGNRQYRNACTKYASKIMAGQLIAHRVYQGLMNLEQRRADNFANAQSDVKTLQAGKKMLEESKALYESTYNQDAPTAPYITSSWIEFAAKLIGDYHPTIDSRIAKIDAAIAAKTAK